MLISTKENINRNKIYINKIKYIQKIKQKTKKKLKRYLTLKIYKIYELIKEEK